jgi:hypothetical protein
MHGLLADKAHRHAELVLGIGLARRRSVPRGVSSGVAHGAGQLQLHFHVGHAMAQCLKLKSQR